MRTLVLICALLLQLSDAGATRARALYAPRPDYPGYGSGHEPGGKGLFVLHVDKKTGNVTSVTVAKSTGHVILDKSAVAAFARWRFQPGTVIQVTIPITFNPKLR
jgi:TonB family protein